MKMIKLYRKYKKLKNQKIDFYTNNKKRDLSFRTEYKKYSVLLYYKKYIY